MKLHLIRHGKAERESQSGRDFDRSLSDKGLAQTIDLGQYLKKHIGALEVWCSDAARTRETLNSILNSCKLQEPKYFIDLYLCSKSDFLQHLWRRKSNEDLIIVGHNFGISDLLNYFVEDSIEMRTSEYYCIDFGDLASNETSQGTGVIADQYRPQV
jgi:phosphohistidine phosphatase